MKQISFLWMVLLLCAAAPLRAQDAATEERLNKLSGRIDDLMESLQSIKARQEALAKDIAALREQASNKPVPNYASQEDVKRLADAVREIDRKRLEDYDKIQASIVKLGNNLTRLPPPHKPASTPSDGPRSQKPVSDNGYEYVIQSGDTLSLIVQGYRDKNIKVSAEQILQANPGLKASRLIVGKKIFIPAP